MPGDYLHFLTRMYQFQHDLNGKSREQQNKTSCPEIAFATSDTASMKTALSIPESINSSAGLTSEETIADTTLNSVITNTYHEQTPSIDTKTTFKTEYKDGKALVQKETETIRKIRNRAADLQEEIETHKLEEDKSLIDGVDVQTAIDHLYTKTIGKQVTKDYNTYCAAVLNEYLDKASTLNPTTRRNIIENAIREHYTQLHRGFKHRPQKLTKKQIRDLTIYNANNAGIHYFKKWYTIFTGKPKIRTIKTLDEIRKVSC